VLDSFQIMKVTFGILLAISLTSLVFPWLAVAVDLMLHVDLVM